MRDMTKLILAVILFSAFSGGLLAALNNGLKDRIEYQELQFVKGPTLKEIMEGSSNNPLSDRFTLKDDGTERTFFVGEFDGKRNTVAFETFGKGFGGNIGVLVAINVDDNKLVGVGVTTNSETPGVGSRTKTDPAFREQFKGMPLDSKFKVKADGGDIDALSGATESSRGVAGAVFTATQIYDRLKPEIIKKLKG
jgi:electron transport complex protein RnfG